MVGPTRDEVAEGFLLLCPGTLSPFVSPTPRPWPRSLDHSAKPPSGNLARAPKELLGTLNPGIVPGRGNRASTPNAWEMWPDPRLEET